MLIFSPFPFRETQAGSNSLYFDDSSFDNSGNFLGGDWLEINIATGDVATFSPVIGQNTDYTVTNNAWISGDTPANSNNELLLTGNDNFRLALRRGISTDPDFIAWGEADSVVCSSATQSCTASWNFGTTQLVVDVDVVTAVPVPAALWLFGSGLLGLAGIAYRRS